MCMYTYRHLCFCSVVVRCNCSSCITYCYGDNDAFSCSIEFITAVLWLGRYVYVHIQTFTLKLNYMTHLLGVFTWLFVYPGNLTVLNRLDSTKCTVLSWTCQSLRILHLRLYVQTTCFSATTSTTRDCIIGAMGNIWYIVIQMGIPCLSPIRNCSLGGLS